MALGAAYEDDAIAALANSPATPAKPAPAKYSVWRDLPVDIGRTAVGLGMGVAQATAEVAATGADFLGGIRYMGTATPEQRRGLDRRGLPIEAYSSDVGDALRAAGRSFKPDPTTASMAEQMVYGFGRGAAKVVGGALAAGPVGVVAAGLEEANTQADELRLQGVDFNTRVQAGAVQGAGLALAALPVVGQTAKATAGLYAIGGPGGFMAQQAATREILQNAGYDKIGAQFDPFDPVGLAVATMLPAGFAAHGLHAQKTERAVKSLPDLPPRADGAPPADSAAPLPFPSRLSPVADAVRAYPTEAVDAARVVLLAERRAAANPGAADNLRAMDQHEAALSRAEDQINAGEVVRVEDVAPMPAPRWAPTETPEFRAWFDGSKVVTPEGAPMVMYHGTAAEFDAFSPSAIGSSNDAGKLGVGFYLTESTGWANGYAGSRDGAQVMPAYVSLRNPLVIGPMKGVPLWDRLRGYSEQLGVFDSPVLPDSGNRPNPEWAAKFTAALREAGHDGVVLDYLPGQREVMVLDPSQIKSAIGNTGRFDTTSGSLTDSTYATWADQITAAIREMQAQARPAERPTPAPYSDGIPAPATGMVRLYRADSPTVKFSDVFNVEQLGDFKRPDGMTGQRFTTDLKVAQYYRLSYGKDAAISYIDVPASTLEGRGGAAGEYFIDTRPAPDAPTTTQAANPEAAAPARGAGEPPAAAGAADAGRTAGVEAAGVTARATTAPVPANNSAPGQSSDAQGADSGRVVTEQQEAASPPADGFVRLYHSGSDPTTGGYFAAVPSGGVFDGFFAMRDGWGSYGTGAKYFADVPETAVLKQHDLDYEIDHAAVKSSLQKVMPWLDEKDFDSAWIAVIEDRAGKIDSEDLQRIMREDSDGTASWEAQRIRGKVAKELGYRAVEMDDENGTSLLIVSGTPLRRVVPNDQLAPISGGASDAAGLTGPAGTTAEAVTERGAAVPLRYRLAEAGDLTTSHTNDLTANPAFPAELQPRDRARAASAEQISRIENTIRPELLGESVKASDGAPIVGPDAVVESGNARTIALRRAYESGKADAYRAWLADNAERFGLTRQQVDGMQRPVLVRERLGDVNRAEFARQANESAVAAMSPTEQAMSDARRITDLSGLVANEDGTINLAQSADFVRQFVGQVAPTERGSMLQANGQLSQAGMTRLRNAVFAKAYGDADILAMLTESTDANVRNVLAGMLRAAPEVAKLADLAQAGARQEADIAGPLVEAVRLFSQLRSEGRTVQQFLSQGSMFGDGLSPDVAAMLEAVSLNARAPKRIAEMIGGMVDTVHAMGDTRQMGMFGDAPTGPAAVAGAAERAVMDSRLAMAAEKFPDLQVRMDGMEAPMPMAEFLAAAKAEADDLAADAPLMQVAAECALLNAAG